MILHKALPPGETLEREQNEYFFSAAVHTISAPWWKIWLAILFGRKHIHQDERSKLTLHKWRGVLYLTNFEKVEDNEKR